MGLKGSGLKEIVLWWCVCVDSHRFCPLPRPSLALRTLSPVPARWLHWLNIGRISAQRFSRNLWLSACIRCFFWVAQAPRNWMSVWQQLCAVRWRWALGVPPSWPRANVLHWNGVLLLFSSPSRGSLWRESLVAGSL